MAVNISYKCPNCGAELFWSADKNCWACEYCDGQFTLKDLEEAGGDAKKAEELNKDNVEKHEEVDKDEYSMSNDGTVGNDLVKYTCSHCGAEIITDRSTAATVCVYCGNAVIMGEQIIDNFSPDYVIPFKVPKNQVMDAFQKFSKKPLTPKDFSCDRVVDKMQGVYIPFWLYSGNCEGSITAEGINTRTWTSGNYRYTEKKYYSVYRNGTLDFKAVPVDASSKTDDDAMDSIEPFDYSEMTAFNPGYLSGYLAERYDEDKDKCLPRAKERIENTTRDELRNTCNYNSVNVQSYEKHTEIKDVKYAMLPTWLLYTTYQDKPYFFAMNGQTGKVIGCPLSARCVVEDSAAVADGQDALGTGPAQPLGRTAAAAHQQGVALRQGDDIEIRDHLATVHRHRRHCQPPPIRRKGQPQRGAVGDGEAPAQQLLH